MDKTLQFQVTGYTGWDSFFAAIYTHRRMAKRIARKALAEGGPFHGADVDSSSLNLLLVLPDHTYQVADSDGNVRVWLGEAIRAAGTR